MRTGETSYWRRSLGMTSLPMYSGRRLHVAIQLRLGQAGETLRYVVAASGRAIGSVAQHCRISATNPGLASPLQVVRSGTNSW